MNRLPPKASTIVSRQTLSVHAFRQDSSPASRTVKPSGGEPGPATHVRFHAEAKVALGPSPPPNRQVRCFPSPSAHFPKTASTGSGPKTTVVMSRPARDVAKTVSTTYCQRGRRPPFDHPPRASPSFRRMRSIALGGSVSHKIGLSLRQSSSKKFNQGISSSPGARSRVVERLCEPRGRSAAIASPHRPAQGAQFFFCGCCDSSSSIVAPGVRSLPARPGWRGPYRYARKRALPPRMFQKPPNPPGPGGPPRPPSPGGEVPRAGPNPRIPCSALAGLT